MSQTDTLEWQIQGYADSIAQTRETYRDMLADPTRPKAEKRIVEKWLHSIEESQRLLHTWTRGAYGMSLDEQLAEKVSA